MTKFIVGEWYHWRDIPDIRYQCIRITNIGIHFGNHATTPGIHPYSKESAQKYWVSAKKSKKIKRKISYWK